MSPWNKSRLEQMIADAVEESLSLDYKRADSLNKTDDKKKAEIVRDVTAMANSSGGILIYGIAEFSEKAQRHLPERLDPISRTEISKEWLDQIIQSIHPRVENVVIHPVTIDEKANAVCYVVEVPQSYTAHQARDHIYYKRHNFQNLPMQDYEVRDVMNRRTHPHIKASIFINRRPSHHSGKGLLLVKLENVGRVLARHFMVDLELPINIGGFVSFGEDAFCEHTESGCYYKIRLVPGIAQPPMFPGSGLTFRREFDHVRLVAGADNKPLVSTAEVKIAVFVDEMAPLRAIVPVSITLKEWTPVV
jgi:hypothetical protein